jgi:hypothetical protein
MSNGSNKELEHFVDGIEIFDDVEVPPRNVRPSYPFGSLEPGQCFMVECEDKKHEASIRSMAVGRNRKAKDNDREHYYIVRRIPGTESTVGVWRER